MEKDDARFIGFELVARLDCFDEYPSDRATPSARSCCRSPKFHRGFSKPRLPTGWTKSD